MARSRRVIGVAIVILLVLTAFGGGWLTGRFGIGATAVDPASLSDLEREFTERLRDVVLVGSFTSPGREGRSPDRYEITSVEKIDDDLWRFNARMNCCGVDGPIPVVVPMRWIGDTPMIMMTNTSIPGLGTYTVRLLFYGDRYAGSWQHGESGGLMTGRIEKLAPTTPST